MIQNSLKIVKNYVIWYIFRWAGGRVTRGGCVDGWVGGISFPFKKGVVPFQIYHKL